MRLFAQDLTTDTLQHIAARGLSEAGGPKPLLLRVLVDLFVRRPTHSDQEIQHFAEIAYTVLPSATAEEIDHAAMRLACHPSAPGDLLDLLASRAHIGALTLLAQSRRLATSVLHVAAAQGSKEAALALASRDDLDATTLTLLAARQDPEIHLRLVENRAAPLDDTIITSLVATAPDHPALAAALTHRLPHHKACWSLFLLAQRAERLTMIGAAKHQMPTHLPASDTSKNLADLVTSAQNNATQFALALSQALSCSGDLAQEIVNDRGGEPLVLALTALGADPTTLMMLISAVQGPLTQGQIIWRQALAATLPRAIAQSILSAILTARRPSAAQDTDQWRRLA